MRAPVAIVRFDTGPTRRKHRTYDAKSMDYLLKCVCGHTMATHGRAGGCSIPGCTCALSRRDVLNANVAAARSVPWTEAHSRNAHRLHHALLPRGQHHEH
jgi:hypothetical protein